MGNKLGVFLAGGLVGAVAALLCAPRTGSETRNMVAEKANAVWGEAQELGAQTASTAQQVVEDVAGADAAEPQRVGIIGRYLVFVSVEGAAVQRETVGKETAILNPNAVEGAVVEQNTLYSAIVDCTAKISAVRPAGVHTEIAVHGEVFGKYNIGGIRNAECNGVRIALIQSAFRILID